MTRWGIVATVKAPRTAILDFAAWHLELGAARIALYLDAPDPGTQAILATHPRLRVIHTDAAWWERRRGRPERHQVRQSLNARHAGNTLKGLDWLAHIDVDEFLVPDTPVSDILGGVPHSAFCARMRPIEALAPGAGDTPGLRSFKAFHRRRAARDAAAARVYGHWADHLSGGFLSHVAGKIFFRPGHPGTDIRIHNVTRDGVQNPGQVELSHLPLAHLHAASWEAFRTAYRFRLERGSYRAELKPQGSAPGARSHHDLFRAIEAEGGEPALRLFYEEVATATPALCAALEDEGLLHRLPFEPARLVAKHFPGSLAEAAKTRHIQPD